MITTTTYPSMAAEAARSALVWRTGSAEGIGAVGVRKAATAPTFGTDHGTRLPIAVLVTATQVRPTDAVRNGSGLPAWSPPV